jgi:hypothetical protein
VSFPPEEIAMARGTYAGLREHVDEIMEHFPVFLARPDKDEIPARVAKYASPEYESLLLDLRTKSGAA